MRRVRDPRLPTTIRVGIVGANPQRGFASIAHIPALQALPEFEISAVCTTRQDSADAAARHYGAPLAFCDPARLAQHPDVDLVTVSVKVPDHYGPVMAAIEAGKHVYCEWPLGRDTGEAAEMLAAAERTRMGFGAVKTMRKPLPMCTTSVDPCYENRADELGCVNPEFHELPLGEPTFKIFARISPSA